MLWCPVWRGLLVLGYLEHSKGAAEQLCWVFQGGSGDWLPLTPEPRNGMCCSCMLHEVDAWITHGSLRTWASPG